MNCQLCGQELEIDNSKAKCNHCNREWSVSELERLEEEEHLDSLKGIYYQMTNYR